MDILEEKALEEQQMDSNSEDYEDDIHYESIKQEGENINRNIQQSMKHFQPANKILSKYVRLFSLLKVTSVEFFKIC